MDFKSFLSDRLAKVEAYLGDRSANRLCALGRVLEIESLAFSLRNGDLLTVRDFDQLDLQAETLRRRFHLHADYADVLRQKPYNGRFLEPQTRSEDF